MKTEAGRKKTIAAFVEMLARRNDLSAEEVMPACSGQQVHSR
jgi:hypothetical protein